MKGVCCECQGLHPVVPNPDFHLGDEESEEMLDQMGDVARYVMDEHHILENSTGPCCEDGPGSIPQAVIPD
jgi:hypothetical protein